MARSEQEQRSSADALLARTGGKPLNFPTSALIAVAVMPWTIGFALSSAAAVELSSVIVHGAQDQPDSAFIHVQAAPAREGLSIADIRVIDGKPAKLSITLPRDTLALAETQGLVFLMFRDLPPGVTFSAGIPMKDAWAVSLKDVANLTLLSPMNVTGRFEIRAMLYRGSRRAAFLLAQTFDPEVLASLFVVGLTPDLQKARYSYARAVELRALEGQKQLDQRVTPQAR